MALINRNLKKYFRNKATVLYSLLGVFIIIGLYALFLGNMMIDFANSFAGDEARFFIDSWIMSGVIIVSTVTTTLGAYSTMVMDHEKHIDRDFLVSPMKRSKIILSYTISAFIIGTIMSLITLFAGELYILLHGSLLSFIGFLKAFGVILLSVGANSAIFYFCMLFIKTENALSAISIVVGSLVGFLTGIYISIGSLPTSIQTVVKLFPPSHAAVLMRQIFISEVFPLDQIPSYTLQYLGIEFAYDGGIITTPIHLLVLFSCMIVFYLVSLIVVSKRKEKK